MNERIKQVRKHYGLTLEKFGERLGLTNSALSLIESGKRNPQEQTLRLICREFGVSYVWLKDGTGEMLLEPDEDDAVNRVMLGGSDFAKLVFRQLAKLPPEAWAQFQSFVDELASQNKKSDD